MGSKTRPRVAFVWLVSVRRSRPPSIARTEADLAPTAKRSPLGENASERPRLVRAGTAASSRPDRESQSRPIASSLVVARNRPSGLKARSQRPRSDGWMILTRSDRLGRSQIAANCFRAGGQRPARRGGRRWRKWVSRVPSTTGAEVALDRIHANLEARAGRRHGVAVRTQSERSLVRDASGRRDGNGPERCAGGSFVHGDMVGVSKPLRRSGDRRSPRRPPPDRPIG